MGQPATKRISYRERWAAFPVAQRDAIAGDRDLANSLDDWQEAIDAVRAEDRAETVEGLYRQLEAIRRRLDTAEQHARRLRQVRRFLFAQLLLAGEQQSAVATRAGVSSPVVGTETGISVKQR